MNQFPIEAVDGKHDKSPVMPSQADAKEILKVLWGICPRHPDADVDWTPDGEFSFRLRRKSDDRIFRVRDFEGRGTVKHESTIMEEEDERTIEREREPTTTEARAPADWICLESTRLRTALLRYMSIPVAKPSKGTFPETPLKR